MKTFDMAALTAVLGCSLAGISLHAGADRHNTSGLRMAHRQEPTQWIGARWSWTIRAAAQGSVVLKTGNGGRSWEDRTPRGFTDAAPDLNDEDVSDTSIGLSALDYRRCWVAFDGSIRGRSRITVEHTADGGRRWDAMTFSGKADSVVLQFLDEKRGFLLALGGPAAGLMEKDFYRTTDGGKTWVRGGSPDMVEDNYYPTGMAFRNSREGWITGSNHGEAAVPLVRTRDGGKTWKFQPLPLPSFYPETHGDAFQPSFHGKSRRYGAFTARLRNNSPELEETVKYLTSDGGEHWHIVGSTWRKPH